jgi:hypothetical protein
VVITMFTDRGIGSVIAASASARRAAGIVCAVLAIITGIVLVVCAQTAGTTRAAGNDANPHHVEFQQAMAESTSGYVISVLSDDKITDAEYSEAETMEAACLKEQGYTPRVATMGGIKTVEAPAAAGDTCAKEYVGPIERLYREQRVW